MPGVDAATRYLVDAGAATAKYGKIEHWDVSCVTDMSELFKDAAGFNADISEWQTGNVVTMHGMFRGATSFDGVIGGWNTASVKNMAWMFYGATSFNQSIGRWNTTSVTDMMCASTGSGFEPGGPFTNDVLRQAVKE